MGSYTQEAITSLSENEHMELLGVTHAIRIAAEKVIAEGMAAGHSGSAHLTVS